MSGPSAREAAALLRALTRSLAVVAAMAGAFTAINTTLFAIKHGVPAPIALLLDPMVALALATVLLTEARLASWGVRPPVWSAVLRWFTGITATMLNTWASIWPDDRIGWPRHPDIAGTVLHGVPPVLLLLLTETIAAYRNRITQLHNTTPSSPEPGVRPQPLPAPVSESTTSNDDARSTLPTGAPPLPTPAMTAPAPTGPHTAAGGPGQPRTTPYMQVAAVNAPDHDVFALALRLDLQHRSRTGHPMSIRQLKTALRIGHTRAKHVRAQLDAHHTAALGSTPAPLPACSSLPGAPPSQALPKHGRDQERSA